ncbi:MAG: hypothetical protein EBY44_07335 [Actinobacteria bacterium]|nr:hypothetical protein [Actinomycetota bacterium]
MRTNRITLLVEDLDRAIEFYANAFGLILIEDNQISENKRIVRIATSDNDVSFNLATPKQGDEDLVGRQAHAAECVAGSRGAPRGEGSCGPGRKPC